MLPCQNMHDGCKSDTKELNTNEANSKKKVVRVILKISRKKTRDKNFDAIKW